MSLEESQGVNGKVSAFFRIVIRIKPKHLIVSITTKKDLPKVVP